MTDGRPVSDHQPVVNRRVRVAPGFTLIELLVVLALIVILIGILIPTINGARNNATDTATRQLMTSVSSSISAFQTDNQRLPGAFTQDELGGNSNPGLTPMQNAVLELAGGIVRDPSNADLTLTMSSSAGVTNTVHVRLADIASKDGPGYLSLGDRLTQPQPFDPSDSSTGQAIVGPTDAMNEELFRRIPQVVDQRSMPILMWARNELASDVDDLAALEPGGSGATQGRAQYYARTNASILSSQSLGRLKVDQQVRSLLGGLAGAGLGSANAVRTLEAIVGNPAFPTLGDLNTPARSRGDVVLHSAGRDLVYLDDRRGSLQSAAYVPNIDDLGSFSLPSGAQAIEQFDDIIIGRN